MADPSSMSEAKRAELAMKLADTLRALGPDGFGVAVSVMVELAKAHNYSRDRFLKLMMKCWDRWVDP